MKYFLLLAAFSVPAFSHAQSVLDSIFYLRIGMENCQFRLVDYPFTYQTEVDSMYRNDPNVHSRIIADYTIDRDNPRDKVIYTRDTSLRRQKFILENSMSQKAILKLPLIPDTIAEVDPLTLEEIEHLEYYKPLYQFETELPYKDFIKIIKNGLELKNLWSSYKVSSALIYYETKDRNGLVDLEYWNPLEKRMSQLKCLSQGGIALLSLKWADGGDYNLRVESGTGFIALIHIKK
jgi:hypothetical protein